MEVSSQLRKEMDLKLQEFESRFNEEKRITCLKKTFEIPESGLSDDTINALIKES